MSPAKEFAAVYCIYDDTLWLEYSMRSIYDCCSQVFFLVGQKPWYGEATGKASTIQLIKSFPDPQHKITLLSEDWSGEVEQRNYGLALLQHLGFQYCFIIDADEIYDPAELRAMMDYAKSRPDIGCWRMRWYTYWKSAKFRIQPMEAWEPPVFLKVGFGYFTDARNTAASGFATIPIEVGVCHHMSYARTDQDISRKIKSFSHARQIRTDWYEKIWKAWDTNQNLRGLHPINPQDYECASAYDYETLPPLLQHLLKSDPDYPQSLQRVAG
jgi:hypothetical protein